MLDTQANGALQPTSAGEAVQMIVAIVQRGKAALDDRNEDDERFAAALKLVLGLLDRPWRDGETVVLKPSRN